MKIKFIVVLVAIVVLMSMLAGCGRETASSNVPASTNTPSSTHIGAKTALEGTVSPNLSNEEYSNIPLHWAKKPPQSQAILSGKQTLVFVVNGNETLGKRKLTSFTLEFTGQTSGTKVTLSNNIVGKVTNLMSEPDYFRMDGNVIDFYPHFFEEGEEVVITAKFVYRKEGFFQQIFDSKEVKGYFTFTVGENSEETFDTPLGQATDAIGDLFTGKGNNANNNGNSTGANNGVNGGDFLKDAWNNFLVRIVQNDEEVQKKAADFSIQFLVNDQQNNLYGWLAFTPEEATPVLLEDQYADLTFFTRASEEFNITQVYVIPHGEENTGTKIGWDNDFYADGCHHMKIDLTEYGGQKVVFTVELCDGDINNPMPDHYFRYLAFVVPEK